MNKNMLRISSSVLWMLIQCFGVQSQLISDSSAVCQSNEQALCADHYLNYRGEIKVNCSIPNTLKIQYSTSPGQEFYYREVRVQCHQGVESPMTCSIQDDPLTENTNEKISDEVDEFIITNMKILPGSICSVSGCYEYYEGISPTIYPFAVKNCTIPVIEPNITTINISTIPVTGTESDTGKSIVDITPTSVFTSLPTAVIEPSITTINISTIPVTWTESDTDVTISATVVALVLFLFVFGTGILLGCMRYQKMSIGRPLLVLDVNDMVYDPNHAPPVSIDKPSFSFSHRISVVSSLDLIQNLKLDHRTAPMENSDVPLTTSDGVSPPYKLAVHNPIRLSGGMHMDGSNVNGNEYILSTTSWDHQKHSTDSTSQLMVEDEVYLSTTDDDFNVQEFTQNNWDTPKHSDTLRILVSNDNQMTTLSPLTASGDSMTDLVHQPSSANHISNVTPTFGDIIQLDLPASKEHNEDSSSQCQSYVVFASQNQHQDQHTQCTQPLCSPISMLDDTVAQLGAPDVDECLLSEDLPSDPMNALASDVDGYVHTRQPPLITTQDDEEASLNLDLVPENFALADDSTADVDDLDLGGLPSTEKLSFPNLTASQDDESFVLDLDIGSVVSTNFAGEVRYSYELEVQQQQDTLKLSNSGPSNAESNYQIHPLSSDGTSQLSDLFRSQHVLGEGQVSDPSFTSDSSPYVLGVRYT